MDWSLTTEEISLIIQSDFIKNKRASLLKLLTESRKKLSPEQSLNLQFEIANQIILVEKEINYFAKSADRKTHNNEWYTRELNKMVRTILKSIADGIAWRYLRFDRAYLRKLADHPQVGHLKNGTIDEMKSALEIVKIHPDCFVVLNDITNCLRYGDLTIIDEKNNAYYIDEVKGGTAKDSRKVKQKKNLNDLLEMFKNKKLVIGDKEAAVIRASGHLVSFLDKVRDLIKDTKVSASGVLSTKLSPYMWIECIETDKYFYNQKHNKNIERSKLPFANKDYYFIPLDSVSTLDQYSPITAPWTVYPFEEDLIMDILTGKIVLTTCIGEKELVSTFRGKGWELTYPDKNLWLERINMNSIEDRKHAVTNPDYSIAMDNGNFTVKFPWDMFIVKMQREYLSAKSIVMLAEYMKKNKTLIEPGGYFTAEFQEEYKMWI